MVRGGLREVKSGVGPAFQAKGVMLEQGQWRCKTTWNVAQSIPRPLNGRFGQKMLGKELSPSPEGPLLLNGDFGIHLDLVFFT